MPDFKNMDIIEISNYLRNLIDNMPQKPHQVFANSMIKLLAEYSKY